MSVQLYAVEKRESYDASWFSWRPVWNYIVRDQKGFAKHGNSNDDFFISTEVLKKGLEDATGEKVLAWARKEMPDYHFFGPEDYEASIADLRELCAREDIRGVICS